MPGGAHPKERRSDVAARKLRRVSPPKSPPKYRRADTGEYTTKKYALEHPKTTVRESK
jgi:hypothetical protein